MSTPTRIYLVKNAAANTARLVEASSQAQALRHAVHKEYEVSVASTKEVVSLLSTGTTLEVAAGGAE